ncbi:hypothetical protein SVA_3166 [Sulfurifustis variabilis]|uniref:Uncharacterized protein n=1 Tax=Sulfurifustis variabilis TaxID=1675686 RepID=A0A1B4VBH7_9GAMM|nr:hypothetical protein [Sulfurifustis variabilis]BAU49714.1 hypothetical protein SVA_3166 [Sulfurifustis variabilis]
MRDFARALLLWVAFALPLNLAWELVQLRFYTLWSEGTPLVIAYSIAHCTIGDAMIAAVAFAVGAAASRRKDWPHASPWLGGISAVVFGIAYTAFSEWFNVYRIASWDYAPSMPLIHGIGLTPLLQWIAIPILMIALFRRWGHGRSDVESFPVSGKWSRQPAKEVTHEVRRRG